MADLIRRQLFKLGNNIKRPGVVQNYNRFLKTQWLPFEELKKMQERQLSKIIEHAYQNVPYYTKLFNRLGLTSSDISTIEDLEKLPILTKRNVKENWQEFIPANLNKLKYLNSATGGSTGTPLKYRLSRDDWYMAVALQLRNFANGGYEPGDKVAVITTPPLERNISYRVHNFMQKWIINHRQYSSADMSQENMFNYFNELNRFKPVILRGQSSSLSLFARFIRDNNLRLNFHPGAVTTTSEKLFLHQRQMIEMVFQTKVFETYGLNDGGVFACDCEQHCGLHINMERAILEVVNDKEKQISSGKGKILATSLYNYALPFLRYETGDLGILSDEHCKCGRKTPLLKEVVGRIQEFIFAPGGQRIYGEFFTHIFYHIDNVSQIQVVQNSIDEIQINIVPDKWENIAAINVDKVKEIIASKIIKLKVNIQFTHEDDLQYTERGKYKFIINNLNHADTL